MMTAMTVLVTRWLTKEKNKIITKKNNVLFINKCKMSPKKISMHTMPVLRVYTLRKMTDYDLKTLT